MRNARKHVPLRTCIACQCTRPKRELIRVVRTPEGAIVIDPRGKLPGRGTYICRTHQCWQTGLEPKKLERVLKCQVSAGDVLALRGVAASLLAEDAEGALEVAGTDDAHSQG
jgi:uncharacterized protein